MAKVICVAGESGSGKTTSMRNLPPDETFYIDADGKGLSWKGWRESFSQEKKNYTSTDDIETVKRLLDILNGEPKFTDMPVDKPQTQFKNIVIDTINALMQADEMRRMKEKGYDKWQDLAVGIYGIVKYSNRLRDDLTIIMVAHTETVIEDSGYQFTRIATSGRKLQKIKLETLFSTVLLAKCAAGEFKLVTHSDGSTVAKTPMGSFKEDEVDNDIMAVLEALKEF